MKKILSLLVIMCTAVCAYASELTFNVDVEGNNAPAGEPTVENLITTNGSEAPEEVLTFTFEYDNETCTVTPSGVYIAVIAGVKNQGTYHDITSPIYQFEWIVDHTTTGISEVEAAAIASKILKDGKFLIDGRVALDGKLVR